MRKSATGDRTSAVSKVSSFLLRYRFLAKLITFGVMLLFVITLASSLLVFSRSYRSLQETTDSAMNTMAQSVCSTMNEYLDLFSGVGLQCIATPYTYEEYITSELVNSISNPSPSVASSYAAGLLRGYEFGLPMVAGIDLYFNSSQRFLYMNYKIQEQKVQWAPYQYFCSTMVPDFNSTEFINRLSELDEPQFLTDSTLLEQNRMIYLLPVSINKGVNSRRVLIFDITADSFEKAIVNTLGTAYAVERLYWKNTCLYARSSDEQRHSVFYQDPAGFAVEISISNEAYQSILGNYSTSVTRMIVLSTILCTALLAMYIIFSYRPLNQIVRKTGGMSVTDELTTVQGYISRKEQMEAELRTELENERELSRLKELEMLLLGIPCSIRGSDPLPDHFKYHFVAVAPLSLIYSVNDMTQLLKCRKNITSFEQYRSSFFVMIIGSDNEEASKDIPSILSEIGWQNIPVGIGAPSTANEQLHASYLDAIACLKKLTQDDHSALEQKDHDDFCSKLMANDISCVQTAEIMFDRLDSSTANAAELRQSTFKLIEQLCGTLHKLGYPVNESDYLIYSEEQDLIQLRSDFLENLKSLLAEGPNGETDAEKELQQNIILYINDNLSNDVFCITDIADTFNMSAYTASRLIRNKTGMYFKRYLALARIDMAKELLASDRDSIQDISQQCGFASPSYFIRVFKNETGVTPLQYRRSIREVTN